MLSGMGSDGTLGIKAIKGELGMVITQNPESAQSESMPKSSIATGLVDLVLPPEQIPEEILKFTRSNRKIVITPPIEEILSMKS